jgi:hypothetical protein
MAEPLEVGFRVAQGVDHDELVAELIANLAAHQLQERHGRAESWEVARVEGRGGEHFYRFRIQLGGFSARPRVKSDLLRVLEELSGRSEPELQAQLDTAKAAGFVRVALVQELDPRWKKAGGRPTGSEPAAPAAPELTGAALYRKTRSRDRAATRVAAVMVVVLAVAVALAALWPSLHPTTGPSGSSGTGGNLPPGTVVRVTLGLATVSNLTCGSGTKIKDEQIPWVKASATVRTDEIVLEVRELADGDLVGGPTSPPQVTGNDSCAGTPPSSYAWYAVVTDPSGVNVATFSYSQGWSPVGSASSAPSIPGGSTIQLLIVPSVANLGYGFFIYGGVDGPQVLGNATL